jgi:hypothetical protein
MTITPAPFSGPDRVGPGYSFALRERGIDAVDVAGDADLKERAVTPPALALIELVSAPSLDLRRCAQRCAEVRVPLIALVSPERLAELESATDSKPSRGMSRSLLPRGRRPSGS